MTDVLVLGDLNPDLILSGDVVPRFGQAEQLLTGADVLLGGSAAIVAHGLARLGRSTRLAAATGDDALADLMAGRLASAGVETSEIVRDPGVGTGVTVVLSRGEDRAVLTYPGALTSLTAERARAALDRAAADGARHLHVASFFLLPALAAGLPDLLAGARRQGLSTSLDTNFDPAGRWEGVDAVLAHLDVLLPNRAEVLGLAAQVCGTATTDPTEAARLLSARGPVVVVKDGAAGALAVDPDGSVLHEAGSPVTAADTTGAGDSFDAAYLDSRLRGLGPAECLRRATLAGALSTSAVGGTAGQPTIDQLEPPGKATDASRH